MINEWVGMDAEGNSYSLNQHNILAFVWWDWGRTRMISVGISSPRAEIFYPGPPEYEEGVPTAQQRLSVLWISW
jgi:hypothetical protein